LRRGQVYLRQQSPEYWIHRILWKNIPEKILLE
jgi:fruct_sucro_rep: D-fructose-responsive transcription factor